MSEKRKYSESELAKLLQHYEDDKLSTAEKERLQKWLDRVDPQAKTYSDLQKKRIQQTIYSEIEQVLSAHQPIIRTKRAGGKQYLYRWISAAAIILLVASWVLFRQFSSPSHQNTQASLNETFQWKEVSSKAGQRLKVGFPDGTIVWLNSNSTLRYKDSFSTGPSRDVYLERGEAFFNVTKDTSRAFIVHTEFAENKVVGTAFNIQLKDADGNYALSMLSGVVELTTNNGIGSQKMLVSKGERAVYSLKDKKVSMISLKDNDWNLWTSNILSFKAANWPVLIQKLEDWYGVKVNMDTPRFPDQLFTAQFKDESLENVLKSLQQINSFRFRIKGKEVYIE